jgi:hypothetical protein
MRHYYSIPQRTVYSFPVCQMDDCHWLVERTLPKEILVVR